MKSGGYFKALLYFFPMQHKLKFVLLPLGKFLDALFRTEKRTTAPGYYLYAIK